MTRFVRSSRRLAPFALVAVLALAAVGCFGPSGGAPVPVMGQSDLSAEQMAAYFWAHQPPGSPCLSVSVDDLTANFEWHGNVENVRGDIAFAQSIVETGWFRYGGSVQCDQNNYGGFLGKSFPDAETGVRAQVQHLRAYADPSATSCSQPPLATPCAVLEILSPTWRIINNLLPLPLNQKEEKTRSTLSKMEKSSCFRS